MQDAHCMSCFHRWDDSTLRSFFNKTWMNGDYKKHREKILFEQEKQKLPDTQPMVRNFREAQELRSRIHENQAEYTRLRREIFHVRQRIWQDNHRAENLEANNYRGREGEGGQSSRSEEYIFPCPLEDCRGYIDPSGSCGTCDASVCCQCGEESGDEHTCNPDNVASFRAIKRSSRRCPGCRVPIQRIDGCSQMWCVLCKTAYDYNTGKIIRTTIHNPHYFEYLRTVTDGEIPRQPGDNFCDDNPIPRAYVLIQRCRSEPEMIQRSGALERVSGRELGPILSEDQVNLVVYRCEMLMQFCRQLLHIYDVTVTEIRRHQQDQDHADLRLRYLLNEIDDEAMKTQLQRREKKLNKDRLCLEIYEMVCVTGGTYLHEYVRREKPLSEIHQLITRLKNYTNSHLHKIERQYHMQAPEYV